jgi:hypothetical protein
MLKRNALLLVAGAALFALQASAASAQDTTRTRRTRPRSTRRIPIQKEAPAPPHVDTVTVYKTDTLQLPGHVDTVTTTTTMTVHDTVTVQAPIPVIPQIGGFYFGIAAGASIPAANFNDSDHPGWRVEVPFGFDPIGSPLGLRFTLGYSQYEAHSFVKDVIGLPSAKQMEAAADLKLRLVSVSPMAKRVQVYGLLGGTYNRYKNILEQNAGVYSVGDAAPSTNPALVGVDENWHNGWGYNVGGGVEIGYGKTNLFVETRYERFKGENSNIPHVPVMIGLTWY